MNQITSRADISQLVRSFYTKVRKDTLLGPIFNSHIPDELWPEHLDKLTDFWETNLFGNAKFRGSPSKKHINIDKTLKYTLTPAHFGKWLQLWFQSINELYEGELAMKAKDTARRMATGQYITIWQNRPEEFKTG